MARTLALDSKVGDNMDDEHQILEGARQTQNVEDLINAFRSRHTEITRETEESMVQLMRVLPSHPSEGPLEYLERIYQAIRPGHPLQTDSRDRRSFRERQYAMEHAAMTAREHAPVASSSSVPSYYRTWINQTQSMTMEPGPLMPQSPVHITRPNATTKAMPRAERAKSRFIDLTRGKKDGGPEGA